MSADSALYARVGSRPISSLRAFYVPGEDIELTGLPAAAAGVVATTPTGREVTADASGRVARLEGLTSGTWTIGVRSETGRLLAEDTTTVGDHPGARPVHGFATSFTDDAVEDVLAWSRATRATVVQIYDWMASYTEPIGEDPEWRDPSNRPVSRAALAGLSRRLAEQGAVAHAYAPIYAVGNAFASDNPGMLLYDGDGQPVRFLDQIVLANPGNRDWQRHFSAAYGSAADELGFRGLHVDTYGYPRLAFDSDGTPVEMRQAYEEFLVRLRREWPAGLISFNQVDGVPSAATLPAEPVFRYCEVWPPNDRWRHFEGLLDRSSGQAGRLGPRGVGRESVRGSIACYPPVWRVDEPEGPLAESARANALRTDLCTEAVVTMLGGSALTFGDRAAALCDPYYPKHSRLNLAEAQTVVQWRRFALRVRDLFIEGEDTSWYEIDDENGSVSVDAAAPTRPEPVGRALFARVTHVGDLIAVGLLDLTGSADGSWSDLTRRGRVKSATVKVLVDRPSEWVAEVAAVGEVGGQFHRVDVREVPHRQGRALEADVPLAKGWAVLRVRREGR